MIERRKPGEIRDAIVAYLGRCRSDASVTDIRDAISKRLGDVAPSSVRSYLRLNTPARFSRTGRGRYRLRGGKA